MYIIGMILKIIGILLLILLGIVLVLLLSVLFVPVRYKFYWEKQPEKPHCIHATLSWWLHILGLSVEYGERFCYVVRVFGFPIKKGSFRQGDEAEQEAWEDVSGDFEPDSFSGESEVSKKDRTAKKIHEEKNVSETLENEKEQEVISGRRENGKKKDKKGNVSKDVPKEMFSTKKNKTFKKENTKKKDINIETDAQEFDIELKSSPKRKLHVLERCMEKVKQFVAFLKKIPCFFKTMFYNIRDLWQNVDGKREHVLGQIHTVLDFWQAEENQKGKKLIFDKGRRIFQHLFPKKCKGYIRFGLSDPASTGQALAVISVISGLVGVMPPIEPDFSQEILEGKWYCRGRLQIGYFVWQGLSLWFHEDMKKIKDNFKKVRRAL